ncbi:C-C motif chemokine 20-like [Lates japonicus]
MEKQVVCVSLLLVLLVALSESSAAKICCTQYQENPIPIKWLKYYINQEITDFCNIKATIFLTMKSKLVCADPDADWVKRAKETVPQIR